MSTPPAAQEPGRQGRGIGRYFRRFANALRRRPLSRGTEAHTTASTPADNLPVATQTQQAVNPPSQTVAPLSRQQSASKGSRDVVPSDFQSPDAYEKIRAMLAKYNLPIEEFTLPPKASVQGVRVEKPIRMRVRIVCHLCQTNYSCSRECTNCQHRRCNECGRWPRKKKRKGKEKMIEENEPSGKGALAASEARRSEYPSDNISPESQRPLRQWKKARVRVRWNCHVCRHLFLEGEPRCAQCSHMRCSECQREPPKRLIQRPSQEVVQSVQQKLAAVASSPIPPDPGRTSPPLSDPAGLPERPKSPQNTD